MKILVIGHESSFAECRAKFGDANQYVHAPNYYRIENLAASVDVVFDFLIGDLQSAIGVYQTVDKPVFLNTVKVSLSQLFSQQQHGVHSARFGFNGMPSMLNRSLLEVSLFQAGDVEILNELCKELKAE